ncbi:wsc domain containing protein [Colletotrichum kahawae]|uniref:Wsc domain containing protein n=1 Tax=Colletotrichum kahawae TaxID=34407 RepID=A0AAD9Y2G1_COLKA|nr:wsc domain containing protein [Colletotrichum kahawae]
MAVPTSPRLSLRDTLLGLLLLPLVSAKCVPRSNPSSGPQPAKLANTLYVGCFVTTLIEGSAMIPSQIGSAKNEAMTAELCATQYCKTSAYFATFDSNRCYCHHAAPTKRVAESECSSPCAGSKTELCGSNTRANFYRRDPRVFTPPTDSSTAKVTSFSFKSDADLQLWTGSKGTESSFVPGNINPTALKLESTTSLTTSVNATIGATYRISLRYMMGNVWRTGRLMTIDAFDDSGVYTKLMAELSPGFTFEEWQTMSIEVTARTAKVSVKLEYRHTPKGGYAIWDNLAIDLIKAPKS